MNKFNVRVIIPILNKTYEIFIPDNILIGNLLYMLTMSINDINHTNINNLLLYSINGDVLNLDDYVFNSISNGVTLILA